MTNKELQAKLAKYPDDLVIEVYDRYGDAFYNVDGVRREDVYIYGESPTTRIQIKVRNYDH